MTIKLSAIRKACAAGSDPKFAPKQTARPAPSQAPKPHV